jgi:glycosyltransferase involved in cell wall biosynthesis
VAPALSVLIANHNSSAFLELSLFAMRELTAGSYQVLISDDGSRPDEVAQLEALVAGDASARLFHRPPEPRGGSWAHAAALDFLAEQVDTPYTAVLDADCTPLLLGWDSYLIDQLDDTTKIIGSSLGESWSGDKPTDFPSPFLALFETETYRRLGISAMPEEPTSLRDSCWQWRPKYLDAGYRGKTLRVVNTRYEPFPPFEGLACGIYFGDDGRIVGSHFGRGSSPTGKRSLRFSARVDRLLRRVGAQRVLAREWEQQRDRWREVCLGVIREQSAARVAST